VFVPFAARAHQSPIRRLGVFFVLGEDQVPSLVGEPKDGLRSHGWIEGQPVTIDDPAILGEIAESLQGAGYAKDGLKVAS